MAKLPSAAFNQSISENVGRPSVGRTDLEFEGLKSLASGVEKLGIGVADIVERRQRAKRDDYLNTVKSELLADGLESEKSDKEFYRGSDHEGYTATRQDWLAEKRKFYMDNAPDQVSRNQLNDYFTNFGARQLVSNSSYENSQRTSFHVLNDKKNRQTSANALFKNPDLDLASDEFRNKNQHALINENYDDAQKAQELQKNSKLVTATLDGFLAQGGAGLNKGKQFLEGKTGHGEMLASLDAKQKLAYEKRFDRAVKAEQFKVGNRLRNSLEDQMAAIKFGELTPDKLLELEDNVRKTEALNKNLKSRTLTNLTLKAKQVMREAQTKEAIKKLPVAELRQVAEQVAIRKVKNKEEAMMKQVELLTLNKSIKLWSQDPVLAVQAEDPTIAEGTKEMYDYIEGRGGNPKIYSKKREKAIIDQLVKSPNRVDELKELEAKWAAEGDLDINTKWIKESSKSNKELAKFARAMESDDPFTRLYLLRSKDQIRAQEDELKRAHPHLSSSAIEDAIADNEAVDSLLDALSAEGDTAGHNAMKEAMAGHIVDQMIDLQDGKTSIPKDIVEETAKRFVSENYRFVESRDTKIALPKKFHSGVDQIQDFLDEYGDLEDLRGEDFEILGIDHTRIKGKNGKPFYSSNEEYVKALAQEGGKFQLMPDGEHFVITFTNPATGNLSAVKQVKEFPDGSKAEVPLLFPLSEIISNNSPYIKELDLNINIQDIPGPL